MHDSDFRRLLEYLQLSWPGYRKVRKGVKKRVARHMRKLGCPGMQAYLETLAQAGDAMKQCELLMSVSISRFFRDRGLWEVLADRILPELIRSRPDRLKAWSAGCACGEEVYSLKILWSRIQRGDAYLPELEITATDLNPLLIERAKKGRYPESSLREIPEELRPSFFEARRGGKEFAVKADLKTAIEWRQRDLFSGPPGKNYHLIFVRNNLFTYFRRTRSAPVLDDILRSLATEGYLITGSHEKSPTERAELEPHPALPYVFKKKA